ncbi:MAG TPA: GH25 family lysozyme, partial [Dysgonamonadaceae bacterium]|nr:GH25 family lysozyme [Dysgonamonadaceae bacterium]
MAARRPTKNKSKRNSRRHRTIKRKQQKIIRIVSAGFLLVLLSVVIIHFVRLRNYVFHTFDDSEFADKYFVRGIDVSHHNSFINWEQLRDENVTFVYLKSTEGMSHKDRNYKKNYRAAKIAGLKVGTYHFYIFGLDGRRQAEHFIRNSNIYSGDMV